MHIRNTLMKRPIIIALVCLLSGILCMDAQRQKSSANTRKTTTAQTQKSTAKAGKNTGTQTQKSSGKAGKSTNSQGHKTTGKVQKSKNGNAQKSTGKGKTTTQQSTTSLQSEQKTIKAEIAQTKKDIDANKKSTMKQLNALDQLKGEITISTNNINNLTQEVRTIEIQEKEATDSIAVLESRIGRLRNESARSLRDNRKNRRTMSELNLIFSSTSFHQALKRSGRIRQVNKKTTDRTEELKESIRQLNEQRQRLGTLRQQHSDRLADLSKENAVLLSKQKETQTLVADLKKQGNALQQALLEKQKRAKALDAEITRLIAEEKRKAEETRRKAEEAKRKEQQKKEEEARRTKDTKQEGKPAAEPAKTTPAKEKPLSGAAQATAALSGSFASNKGKLLFPVAGKYNIVSYFGRNQHEDLPNVEIDNSGIDILAQPGSSARAVFDGVVSMIVNLGGPVNVVMVRHGEYITVYSNIKSASVKKGDAVKAGQAIGTIYTDASDNNRTILHFEVRKETQKLNPLLWVKR